MEEKHYVLTPQQVAKEVGCSDKAVTSACHAGKIDFVQGAGRRGHIRIEEHGFQAWAEAYAARGNKPAEDEPAQLTLIGDEPAKAHKRHRNGGEGFEAVLDKGTASYFHGIMEATGYTSKQEYATDLFMREYYRLKSKASEMDMTPDSDWGKPDWNKPNRNKNKES